MRGCAVWRLLVLMAIVCVAPAFAQSTPRGRADALCSPVRQAAVQARLEQLRTEDQADRTNSTVAQGAEARDLARRQEVASLFAEGCFSTGRDFHNAALVFQHGVIPDHYYLAWVWARRAVELGDTEAQWLVPRAIDRYLMISGYKQLFATNLVTDGVFLREGATGAWCVWPTVSGLTDDERVAVGGRALPAQIERVREMNQGRGGEGGVCAVELPDPPRGLFPGMW